MRRSAILVGAVLLLAACESAPGLTRPSSAPARPSVATSQPSLPPTSSADPTPRTSEPRTTAKAKPTRSSSHTRAAARPGGGQKILGRVRVVAYYGVPGNRVLGVLGSAPPEQIATSIERRAATFRGYGLPVQPAMELITTVAQSAPGPDGDYSSPIPLATVRHYLEVAHAHRMLLVLDLQPGRASFLSQAKPLRSVLLDPSVSLALDPEWKVGPGEKPGGGRIGTSSAAGINAVGSWLSALITANHLPDKLLLVHQFTRSMLPDRSRITQHRGVEMVLHADGFGTQAAKIDVFDRLAFPHPPFGIGFKLFLTHDIHMMSPAQVMALRPQPAMITYQ